MNYHVTNSTDIDKTDKRKIPKHRKNYALKFMLYDRVYTRTEFKPLLNTYAGTSPVNEFTVTSNFENHVLLSHYNIL